MARIVRKYQKEFAKSASNLGQIGSAAAGTLITSTDPDVLQALPAMENGIDDMIVAVTTPAGVEKLLTKEETQSLFNLCTRQLAYIFQEGGTPEYDPSTTYHIGSKVRLQGTIKEYISTTDDNVGNPVTDYSKWEPKDVGDGCESYATSKFGYILADGGTIGDATSGGTLRANADCWDLFYLLWANIADAEAPVSGGRGATATADFAAHKTITVPDERGYVVAGKGGAVLNTIAKYNTMGGKGGEQTHLLSGAESGTAAHGHSDNFSISGGVSSGGAHTHEVYWSGGFAASSEIIYGSGSSTQYGENSGVRHISTGQGSAEGAHSHSDTLAISGGVTNSANVNATSAHNNVQPVIFKNKFIKY